MSIRPVGLVILCSRTKARKKVLILVVGRHYGNSLCSWGNNRVINSNISLDSATIVNTTLLISSRGSSDGGLCDPLTDVVCTGMQWNDI